MQTNPLSPSSSTVPEASTSRAKPATSAPHKSTARFSDKGSQKEAVVTKRTDKGYKKSDAGPSSKSQKAGTQPSGILPSSCPSEASTSGPKPGTCVTQDPTKRMETFKKSKGDAGLSGVQFQLNLLTVCLLNALRNHKNWKISTENEEAGKFDDIVIELPDGSAILIQSKHKDNKNVTKDQLLSPNSKNADFSLAKYFFSYEEIKNKFKAKTVIICTNTAINMKGLKDIIISQPISPDSILYFEGSKCSCATFNDNILPELKENLETYYDGNLKGKRIDKAIITDENVRDFLKNSQLFSKYPSGDALDRVIRRLLSRLGDSSVFCHTSSQEIHEKIKDWFKQRKGEYLTENRAKAMFCEIKSDQYCTSLRRYDVSFERNDLSFTDPKQIFHIKMEGGRLLGMLKVYHALKDHESKKLFVNPQESLEVQRQTIEAFKLSYYTYLVMIWSRIAEGVTDTIEQILKNVSYKKVILVAEDDIVLNQRIGLENVSKLHTTLMDLSKDSRERLLKAENVIFQGHRISLEKLFGSQTAEDCAKFLNSETLEKLIRGQEFNVGVPVLDLDQDTASHYIERTLVRKTKQTGGGRRDKFSEESIYQVNEKFVTIVDAAGMGKTTVMTMLATAIKQKCPHLWVIRMNLNDYTRILWDSIEKNKKVINVMELLNSQQATKLTSDFEKHVFSTSGKIVLMLDGLDEISPDYTDLMLGLLSRCQEESNFYKIFVTTRPHVAEKMEKTLKVESFEMLPFTRHNQTDFLVRYWTNNLALNDADRNKCKKYAKALLDKMSSWVKSYYYGKNTFPGIPLHVRMMAEIFQERTESNDTTEWEGCKEYLEGHHEVPKLPEIFNIAELYDIFIKKKQNIFMAKECSGGNVAANIALKGKLKECLDYHHSLALIEVLGEMKSCLFSSCPPMDNEMESFVLKLGIVQKPGRRLQFLHRTFAEYFVARSIQRELENKNANVDFQIVLIEILVGGEFGIVRVFLNNFLREIVDSLSSDIFENYKSSYEDKWPPQDNIINILSREGHVEILRLILKNIGFKIIKSERIDVEDWLAAKKVERTNILKDPQMILGEVGLNFRERNGYTPLHWAAQEGQLEMVKFLVKNGANINSRDCNGQTVLHSAAEEGNRDVVKYLVDQGADVNSKDDDDQTILCLAAEEGNWDVVKYLVEHGADVNSRDDNGQTILRLTAEESNWDVVKYLVEQGADVNSRDDHGQTVLHLAAEEGNWDVVKYLVEQGADVNSRNDNDQIILHSAAEGNWDVVKYLVEQGADVNSRNFISETVLHLAAEKSNCDVVKYLVEQGADVNSRDNSGETVLHSATKESNWDVVKYLVEQGADVNSRDDHGQTVLHSTAEKGNWDVVRYLVEQGADVNSRDDNGETILHSAAEESNWDVVRYLVEQGADVNSRNDNDQIILHSAAEKGNWDVVRYLVEQGADVNSRDDNGETILHSAAEESNWDVVRYLLEQGADVNSRNDNDQIILHSAAEEGNWDVVKYLVEHGADVDSRDDNGETVLHSAAEESNWDVVKYLVEQGADINSRDDNDQTILCLAAEESNWNVVKYLVEQGADVNSRDDYDQTVLHLATEEGNRDVVKYLVEHGADVNSRDDHGQTVLHLAAEEGNWDVVKYLVEQGADVDSRDDNGRTILHSAACTGDLHVVKCLFECGADVNVENSCGKTALQLASDRGNEDIVEYLDKVATRSSTDSKSH